MEMLLRDARDEERDVINKLKLNAYEEHAHKIQERSLGCSKKFNSF